MVPALVAQGLVFVVYGVVVVLAPPEGRVFEVRRTGSSYVSRRRLCVG